MSRHVRDLTIEDLGQLKALSHFKLGKLVCWRVQCSSGEIHEIRADYLTRKNSPLRACGVCGKHGYIDRNTYKETISKPCGWLTAWGRMRPGDIRDIALAHKLYNRTGAPPSKPYSSCRCRGRELGHPECLGWVRRSARELRSKKNGSCAACASHYRQERLETFAKEADRVERLGHVFQPSDKEQRKDTAASLYAARCRVKLQPKYQSLGMYEPWKGPEGVQMIVDHIGLRPSRKHSLERIDNERGYYPDNIKWELPDKQAENRSTARLLEIEGKLMNLSCFASLVGQKPSALSSRIAKYVSQGFSEAGAVERILEKAHSVRSTPEGEKLI